MRIDEPRQQRTPAQVRHRRPRPSQRHHVVPPPHRRDPPASDSYRVDNAVIAVHRNHITAKENPVCRRSAHYADYATAWAPAFAPLTPYL